MITDSNRKWWILGATSGVLGLTVLDETIVGVALVTMKSDLVMSQVAAHWVVNAYLLTFTCFVAIGGKLGDTLGHRGFFVAGAAIFGLASLAAGFAPSGAWLIAARALQGIGAAITFPASLAMLSTAFPPDQRGVAFGVQVTIAALFMSSGPLVGGLFTELVSWRWIFWINLPVVATIGAVVLAAWVPPQTAKSDEPPAGDDVIGLVTLVVGLSAIVIALMEGADWGGSAPATFGLSGAGVALLAVFAVAELRIAQPLIELNLLRIETFTGGNLVFFTFQFNKIAVFVFVALYLQDVVGESPIDAGLALVAAVAPTLLTSYLAGRATDRYGSRRPGTVALVLNGAAVLVIGIVTYGDGYGWLFPALVVWGLTLPFIAVSARRALMSAVPKDRQGQAGGVNLTIQMVGGTVGMALCGTLLVATGDYGSVFLMTGALVLLTAVTAWLMIERTGAIPPKST